MRVALLAVLATVAACRPGTGPGGSLQVRWNGNLDKGLMTGPGRAVWCPADRRLLLEAWQGDTMFAVSVQPAETLAVGDYRVVKAAPWPASVSRPSASTALRVLSPDGLRGYQGDAGSVRIDDLGGGRIAGSVSGGMATYPSPDERLGVAAKFTRIPLVADDSACRPPS